MSKVQVVEGEIFRDERGQISSLNAFRFPGVERCYFIHHPDISVVRGWHGHQFEKKWFYCVKGSFTVALVEVDDWENPSPDLEAEIFELSESDSKIICVPEGYANSESYPHFFRLLAIPILQLFSCFKRFVPI